ncbi:hypothetical protein FY534_11595 [Alicyclobacillus sp. TC]|uniref:hypothetical protein n=1 Tax=Alicyclobacillus tolerans TaxID=90970 RepID=UPI001933A088|nr:hypothetical protein FY534_11595 [Alicyclobacillus sp. TC]
MKIGVAAELGRYDCCHFKSRHAVPIYPNMKIVLTSSLVTEGREKMKIAEFFLCAEDFLHKNFAKRARYR